MNTPTCANCKALHATWQCPEIRALLFATDNAPIGTICSACQEDAMTDDPCDPFGISLELRQQVRTTAAERVEYAPF